MKVSLQIGGLLLPSIFLFGSTFQKKKKKRKKRIGNIMKLETECETLDCFMISFMFIK